MPTSTASRSAPSSSATRVRPSLSFQSIVRLLELIARSRLVPSVNRGVVVLPKSVTEKRIVDNLRLVKLDDGDMDTLNSLHKTKGKRFIKPECARAFPLSGSLDDRGLTLSRLACSWNVDLGFEDW